MISRKRRLYSVSLFLTVLLGWLPAIAQTSSAQASKSGAISGRVVNESGQPLRNVSIILRRVGWMNIQDTSTTNTDREGKFEVSGLQPASYEIFAFLRGYAPQLQDLSVAHVRVSRIGDSVTLVLTKGGAITGRVTNQAGEPVVGVNVRALMVDPPRYLPYPYNLIGVGNLTDDRGIYRIYGLPEGSYVVWAGGGGEPRYTSNIDPFDSDVPTYAPASTRDTAQEFIVRAGAETNNVDIQYRGGSGHTVSGSARGPQGDRPLQFRIDLVSAGGPQWETRAFQDHTDRGFMLNGVDDGDYYLFAISNRLDGEIVYSAAKQIKVRGADVSGIELVVEPSGSVAGRVVLEEIKTSDCRDKQRPVLTETLVSAQSNVIEAFRRALGSLPVTANVDERGNMLLKNLPAGRYYFTTRHFAKDWYLKSLSFVSAETASMKTAKPLDAARNWTTIKPGDRLNGLTITLAQGAASLRGQIALSKGETLEEKLFVYLVPAEREMVDDPLRFYGAAVTSEGKVELNNLAPGRYLVFARGATDESAAPDEAVSPLKRPLSPDATAYRARLRREAETLKAEIELKPCQRVDNVQVRVKSN